MMNRSPILLALAGLVLSVAAAPRSAAAQGGDLKFIANPSVAATEISVGEIKAVFLITKTSLADGTTVEPVLTSSGPAHRALLSYLGKTDATLTAYLRGLVFTGKASMPKTCDSDAEVVAYVAKTRGAVGYVSAGNPAPGTKTLSIKGGAS
jgi:ABC-type branched-subunit amino acid transport system substrate-binding protein